MAAPEIWKPVPSVPGLLASSHGRVMVKPFIGTMPHGGKRQYGGFPRKGCWDGERYIFVWRGKTYKVGRLVCEAFHGMAPKGKRICMHKDEDSTNNVPMNLKWGTQKENLNAPGFIAYCQSRTGDNNPHVKGRMKLS